MRGAWRTLLLSTSALLALASCTGTFEELPPALLLVGTDTEIRFVEAASIQPGSDVPPFNLVATWPIAGGVVDLFKPTFRSEFWVLSPQQLTSYATTDLSSDSANFPSPQQITRLELPVSCARGYLRGGQSQLLVVCGAEVWLVSYNQPSLRKQDTTGLSEATRYALGPEDALLYLVDNTLSLGLNNPVQATIDNPSNLTARDLVYEPFSGKAYALFSENFDTLAASWTPANDSKTAVQDINLVDLERLSAGRYGVVGYGPAGMARIDQVKVGARGNYQLGLSGPTGFVYLIKANLIEVFDLLTNELDRGLVNPLGTTPTALAHVLLEKSP